MHTMACKMNNHRPVATLFFLYLILVNGDILGPVTETTVEFTINGNPTTVNRAEFIYTENTQEAVSFVGNYQVTSHVDGKPGYNYVATEVAAIPAFMTTYIQEACLVKDVNQFISGRINSDPLTVAGTPVPPSTQTLSVQKQGATMSMTRQFHTTHAADATSGKDNRGVIGRRLLEFGDIVAIGIATAALAVGTAALASATRANARIDVVNQILNQQATSISLLQTRANITNQRLDQLTDALNSTQSILQTQQAALLTSNQNIARVNAGLSLLQNSTQSQFNTEEAKTASALNTVDSQISLLGNATAAQIQLVYTRIANVTQLLSTNINSSFTTQQQLAQKILTLNNIVWDMINQRQLRGLITGGIFDFIATLPSTMFPLVTDPGVAPDVTSIQGTNSRLLLETVTFNYVTSVGGGRRIMRRDFNFWVDTEMAIDNAHPYTTWDILVQMYGPSACVRPTCIATNGIQCPDAIDLASTQTCGIWVEEVVSYCQAAHTTFEWKTANASLDAYDQSPNILTTYCSTSITHTANIYRDPSSVNTELNNMCYGEPLITNTEGGTYYMVTTTNLNAITFIPGPRLPSLDCFINVGDPIPGQHNSSDAYTTPTVFTHTLLEIGFPSVLNNIFEAQMRYDGRMPDGLDFYTVPFTYAPTQRVPGPNNTTQVVYDGGADSVQCHYATLLAASNTAIPVYSIVPWTDNLVTANIVIDTVERINQQAPDYDVDVSSTSQQVQFDPYANFMLPAEVIFVGFLPSLGNGPTVLYDVPPELLTVAGGYTARINKLTCYDMPPGTRRTWDLSTWTSVTPRVYKASQCGVSAASFAYNRVSDAEGYPLCDVSGAIPDDSVLTSSINGTIPMSCQGGFLWYGAGGAGPAPTYTCNAVADPGVLLAKNGTLTSGSSALTLDFTDDWALSILYWTSITSGATRLFSYNSPTTLLVVDGGQNIVVTGAGVGQVLTVPVYHANSPSADSHVVFIRWVSSTTTLTLVVDGITLATDTTWAASTQSAYSGSYPHGLQVLGTLVPGNNANVQALEYYASSVTVSDADISDWSDCLFSFYVASQQCVPNPDITENSNAPLSTTAPLVNAYQTPSPTCLPTTIALPVLFTDPGSSSVQYTQQAAWTITFWLDHVGPGLSAATMLDTGTSGGWQFQIYNTGGVYKVRFNSYSAGNSTSAVTITPSLDGTVSHFIALVVNVNQVKVYVDTILATTFNSIVFGSSTLDAITMYPQATMARYYSGYMMPGGSTMQTALRCDLPGDVTNPNLYRTPLAVCTPDPILATNGYCRHPTMCQGHCSAWTTTLNKVAGTFTAALYQCDVGWEGTNCDQACVRKNALGQCTDGIDPTIAYNFTQTGIIAGASMCIRYKFFQVDSYPGPNGLTIVSFYPRQYQIRATLALPSGTITTALTGGSCPSVVLGTPDGTTVQFQLKNTGTVDIQYLLVVVSSLAVPPDPQCEVDQTMEILPLNTGVFNAPACGNITVQIKTLSGADSNGNPVYNTDCGPAYQAVSLQQGLDNNLAASGVVAGAIAIAQDQTVTALNNNALGLMGVILNIMQIQAQAAGSTEQMLQLISAAQTLAANATTNLANVNFTKQFAGNVQIGGSTFQNIIDSVANSTANFPSQYNVSVQLNSISENLVNLGNLSRQDSLVSIAIDQSINKTKFLLQDLANLPSPSDPDFGNYLLDAIKTVGGIPADLVDSAIPGLTGLFGGLGGIGNFISEFIEFGIFAAIVYVVYQVISTGLEKRKERQQQQTSKISGPGTFETDRLVRGSRARSNKY